MGPYFIYVFVALGVAVAAAAGFAATRTRAMGSTLAERAQKMSVEVPPLVAGYFRAMARGLTWTSVAFLTVAVVDAVLSRFGTQELLLRSLGFVSATALLGCGTLLVMSGTVDMKLRMGSAAHRLATLIAGVLGISLSATAMVQLVKQGRLWL